MTAQLYVHDILQPHVCLPLVLHVVCRKYRSTTNLSPESIQKLFRVDSDHIDLCHCRKLNREEFTTSEALPHCRIWIKLDYGQFRLVRGLPTGR
ncbi:hypothetical protein TNCV_3650151 [Trichonephila clavipes]|nr:hypothetical protein TNCV_3650151 [Trichonephila clavipes]